MSSSEIIAIISNVVQVMIFIVAALILPSVKRTANELHLVQVEMAGMKEKLTGIEALRANLHHTNNEVHEMKLQLAVAGFYSQHPAHSKEA